MRLFRGISLFWSVLLGLALLPGALMAGDFQISEVKTRLMNDAYVLDAEISYQFNDVVLEALSHGVSLALDVHIQVRREGAWIWEQDVSELRLRYLISYHALTSLYEVTDVAQGVSRKFITQEAALDFLGEIQELPIVNLKQLAPGSSYVFEMRTQLDIEALPLPLRPLAYLTPAWNLSSGWSSWPLIP